MITTGNVLRDLRKHLPPAGSTSVLLVVPPYKRLAMPRHSVRYLAATLMEPELLQRVGQNSRLKVLNSTKQPNIHVRILDLSVAPDDFNLVSFLTSFNPTVLGITADAHSIGSALEIARLAPQGTLKVAGGYFPSAQPTVTIKNGFDIAVIGAGEETLVELVLAKHSLKPNQFKQLLTQIPGISYRPNKHKVKKTLERRPAIPLDDLPFPHQADELQIFNHYPGLTGSDQASIVSARGCGSRCLYCAGHSVTLGKLSYRSADNILAEINELYRSGARTIVFDEEDFMLRPRAEQTDLLTGLKRLKDQDPTFGWAIETRGDKLSADSIIAMASAGLKLVAFGVETLHEPLARQLKASPRLSIDTLQAATRTAQMSGVEVIYNMMVGTPGYGWREALVTARKLNEVPPDQARTGKFKLYPGSPFFQQSSGTDRGQIKKRHLEVSSPDQDYPVLPTKEMTTAEMDLLEGELEVLTYCLTIAQSFPERRQEYLLVARGIIEAFRIQAIYDLFLNSPESKLSRDQLLDNLPADIKEFIAKRRQGSAGFSAERALEDPAQALRVLGYRNSLLHLNLPEVSYQLIDLIVESVTVTGGEPLAQLPLERMTKLLAGITTMTNTLAAIRKPMFTRIKIKRGNQVLTIAQRDHELDQQQMTQQVMAFVTGQTNEFRMTGLSFEYNEATRALKISPAN